MLKMHSALVMPIAIAIFLYGAVLSLAAETPRVGPQGAILGESCKRQTDNFEGIVKVDACGRWYCGRIDVNDITVLSPQFAEKMFCTWRLINDKCKCVRS
jgi:hypothetical protein